MTLEEYAKKILTDAGCDEYTYGGKYAEKVLDDLKEAFKPGELEYPYVEVANAILEMSRPKPIKRAPYLMVWDHESACDGVECRSYGEAKCAAEDMLIEWMCEERNQWADMENPTEEEKGDWDYMIYNCGVYIQKYNPETDEYEECGGLTYEEEAAIGWDYMPFDN